MGGRGSGSGRETGFEFNLRGSGKKFIVQKTKTGQVLVNGQPRKDVDYETLKKSSMQQPGFKELTDAEIRKRRRKRNKERANKPDYEMGYGKGWNDTRGRGKRIYRPRRSR